MDLCFKPEEVVHTSKPNTGEAEVDGLEVWAKPGLMTISMPVWVIPWDLVSKTEKKKKRIMNKKFYQYCL